MSKEALIMVDPQVDFCPGGALAVKEGDKVIPILNETAWKFKIFNKPVYASRDYHNPNNTEHINPKKWPPHCIEETEGANFHPDLKLDGVKIVTKGTGLKDDGYSAFEGVLDSGKTLEQDLREEDVDTVVVGGLATDYCVRATVFSALKLGFNVKVILDAIRAVNLKQGDGDHAIAEMKDAGAEFVTSQQIIYQA
jgi:nicotinamidase/pyrazinamidase